MSPVSAAATEGARGRRLAVYCDYPYRLRGGRLSAEQPVALFFSELAAHCDRLTMVGRLDPAPGAFPYAVEHVDFVALPHYRSGASPTALARALPVSLARFWRMLGHVDTVWVLGPTMLAPLFATLTLARGRRLVLGVRQDMLRLFAHRHPGRPVLWLGAAGLEASFRLLARRVPVAVVGPQLARSYRRARSVHTMYVSLLRERDIVGDARDARDYAGSSLRMLSVGRLDPEKNPLLLADILAAAVRGDPRWQLEVCGDGPLAGALARRLAELGVAERATLHGHVPLDGGLLDLYRSSHALIHVSFSEGVPQVLLEAFAMRLPVVATAVGGVPELVGDAGRLVAPDDAAAAVRELERIASDDALRAGLVARGLARARRHTRESEVGHVARFVLGEPEDRRPEGGAGHPRDDER